MFAVNVSSERMKADKLHNITAKLLHVSNRAGLDIKLVIAVAYTRVSKNTVQNWGELKRVLKYLKGTLDMPRVLGADIIVNLMTCVDTVYTAHTNTISHIGGATLFETGLIMCKPAI